MSYCRWSTDDFQCDLYCYESAGGFTTHVAANRMVFKDPIPPPVPFDEEHIAEWAARFPVIIELAKNADRQPIGLPYDGETFHDASPEEFLARLLMLRDAGYRFPDYVLTAAWNEVERTYNEG